MSDVRNASQGRWVEILTRLGADGSSLDGKHRPCPSCAGTDRFRFDNKEDRGTHICSQCGAGDGFELVQKMFSYSFKDAAQAVEQVLGIEGKAPSKEEQQAYKQKLAGERIKRANAEKETHRIAANESLAIWEGSALADDSHPYLKAKNVKAYGVNLDREDLLIPVRIGGNITSIQRINPDGSKMFQKGGEISGGSHYIAGADIADMRRIYIAEGYATGATIREATGCHVAVAFNAGNLGNVAKAIRSKLPDIQIIIAGDNDESKTGETKGNAAAGSVGGLFVMPPDVGSDWNDVHLEHGLDVVVAGIANAASPDMLSIAKVETVSVDDWSDPQALPAALLPVESFDADMLPNVFKDYALDVSSRMQCPIEFVATSIMTTFGGVVGKRCSIYPKAQDNWLVVPNLWGALVGRPSTMKSPAITASTAGVDCLVKDARTAYTEALEKVEVDKMVFDAETKQFKDAIGAAVKNGKPLPKDRPSKPEQPTEQRYVTNAGSVENLIKLLSENDNGLIQLRDELMGWIRSMDNPNSQDARSFYLEAWNGTGSSFSYDTMSHGNLCLETGACVSVLGGVQPSLLASIVHGAEVGNSGDDGMLQRFQLLVYPDRAMTWKYCDRKPNQDFADAFKAVFTSVVDVSCKAHFTDDAQEVFIDWYTKLMKRNESEEHLGLESHFSKYPQLMPAMALLIHLAEHVMIEGLLHLPDVSKVAALKAVQWCEFLESHARRIYAMGDSVGVDAAYRVVDAVIGGRLSSPFKVGELQCKKLGGLRDADSVNEALNMLENYGWLRLESVTTRGRPSVICHVHPQAEYFRKRPDTPVSKASKGGKSDFTGFTDTPSGTFSKNNGELESDSKEDISPGVGLSEVGVIGADGKIIMPSNDDESTTKQVRYF